MSIADDEDWLPMDRARVMADRIIEDSLRDAGGDQPPIPDLADHLRDMEREAERARRIQEITERGQAVLRAWKRAEAEDDEEGKALCRAAAQDIQVAYVEAMGGTVLARESDHIIVLGEDAADRLPGIEGWSWT